MQSKKHGGRNRMNETDETDETDESAGICL